MCRRTAPGLHASLHAILVGWWIEGGQRRTALPSCIAGRLANGSETPEGGSAWSRGMMDTSLWACRTANSKEFSSSMHVTGTYARPP